MYDFRFDRASGILELTLSGYLLPQEFPYFAARLRLAVAAARLRNPRLRLLVDSPEGAVMTTDFVVQAQALGAELLCEPGDRAAIVIGPELARLRARRPFDTEVSQSFTSAGEARRWLLIDLPEALAA